MFSKEQVETIARSLKLLVDSHHELIEMYAQDSKRLPAHQLEKMYGDDHATLLQEVPPTTKILIDTLLTAEGHLRSLKHKGRVYVDIPMRDSESWENITILNSTVSAVQYARDTFGANDFGYISLLTLGEKSEE